MTSEVEVQPTFEVQADGAPRLVLGWRPASRRLTAARVPLRDDVFDALREIPQDALARLEASTARPYEPAADLEEGEEHFLVPISEVPFRPAAQPKTSRARSSAPPESGDEDQLTEHRNEVEQALPEVADLMAVVSGVDGLVGIDAGRLAE